VHPQDCRRHRGAFRQWGTLHDARCSPRCEERGHVHGIRTRGRTGFPFPRHQEPGTETVHFTSATLSSVVHTVICIGRRPATAVASGPCRGMTYMMVGALREEKDGKRKNCRKRMRKKTRRRSQARKVAARSRRGGRRQNHGLRQLRKHDGLS